jgi:hypothetical protein
MKSRSGDQTAIVRMVGKPEIGFPQSSSPALQVYQNFHVPLEMRRTTRFSPVFSSTPAIFSTER